MIRRVARIFVSEMAKTWRTKFPYLGLLASALMALIARQSVSTFGHPDEITATSYFTTSVNMATTMIIPIFATIFASMSVCSEIHRGTLRAALTRPVSRFEFLSAKLATCVFYLLLLFAANVVPAVLLARAYPFETSADFRVAIPGPTQQVAIYATAMLLTFLPQLATMCFAFFISAVSHNVATSTGVAIGLLLTLYPLKEYVEIGAFKLKKWLAMSYYDTAMGIASEKTQGIYATWFNEKIHWLLLTSLATVLLFTAMSYASFLKRDMNG